MRVVLLSDIDEMGVLRKAGTVIEAEEWRGTYCVQMGFGSYLYLVPGVDAQKLEDSVDYLI